MFKYVIPVFNGHLTPLHPVEFLLRIDNYFQSLYISDQSKIFSIRDRLMGDARAWMSAIVTPTTTYTEFINLFRQNFWASSHQKRVRSECTVRIFTKILLH